MIYVYLSNFFSVLPKNKVGQRSLINWLASIHTDAEKLQTDLDFNPRLLDRYAVKETQIASRYFESDDLLPSAQQGFRMYQLSKSTPQGTDIAGRTAFFGERSLEVAQKMYSDVSVSERPDHIVHVTCTGYSSPSAPQKLVASRTWQKATAVTHAYHMGCYASLPAIRMARALTVDQKSSVDIVHTEMCGLHLNTLAHTPEQMIVQTLFADGHIKYSVGTTIPSSGFRLSAILEKIIPDSENDMTWSPAAWGMQMQLSREVPEKIRSHIASFLAELLARAGLPAEAALTAVFAIHPGGPKIISSVQEILNLSDSQILHSRKILLERGNMSSSTLPHVWQDILAAGHDSGTQVISFAFGPGLTLFGSVFEVV